MDTEYMKKDLTKSPKKKSGNTLPEGWQLNLIRGVWKVRDSENTLTIYATEEEAWDYING
jgi:hypothetical protein